MKRWPKSSNRKQRESSFEQQRSTRSQAEQVAGGRRSIKSSSHMQQNRVQQQCSAGTEKSHEHEHKITRELHNDCNFKCPQVNFFMPTSNLKYLGLCRERKRTSKFPKEQSKQFWLYNAFNPMIQACYYCISSFHIKFCFGSLDESVIGANFLEDIDWISEEPEAQAC